MDPWKKARLAQIQYVTDPRTGRRWPIPAGGSDAPPGGDGDDGDGSTGDGDGDGPNDGDGDPPDGDPSALGDAGKRALDSMKAQLKQERAARRAAETERDRLKGADGPPVDVDSLRESIKTEIRVESAQRIARAEVKAAATGKLADPADALSFIDPTTFVSDSGDVDEDAIAKAITDLVKNKPYLAAQGARFDGSGDNGPRKETQPEVGPGLPRLRRAYETST